MLRQRLYRIIIILLFLYTQIDKVAAQHEFVATIDPEKGTIHRIDSIPGVMWIAPHAVLDDNNKRLLFVGLPPDHSSYSLYSIDAISGRLISKALLPKSPALISFRYDNPLNILYGITVASGVYSLVSIDPNTGIYSTINTIKAMRSLSEEMIVDNNSHRIFLNCLDTSSHFTLISLDIKGNLLSKVTIPNVTGLQYDNTTNKIYGLRYNGTQEEFINLDPSTGSVSTISSLPADLFGIIQYSTTFDETQHRFIFAGGNKSGSARLFTVDVNTGTVIYSPTAPASANSVDKDNVIQFRYSNSLKQLYALHWKAFDNVTSSTCDVTATKIYYNPGNSLIVEKAPTTCVISMTLYTELGQVILNNKLLSDGYNKFRLPLLPAGVYFFQLFSGNNFLQRGKLLISR